MPSAATLASSARTIGEHVVDLGRAGSRPTTPTRPASAWWRGEGVDRVGQAAPLAHLLEQPRRRAAAEGGVEHAEGVAARRRCGSGPCMPSTRLTCSNGRRGARPPGVHAGARGRAARRRPAASSPVEEAAAAEGLAHLAYDGRRGRRCRRPRRPCCRAGSGAGRTGGPGARVSAVIDVVGAGDRAAQRRVAPGLRRRRGCARRRRGRRRASRSRRGSRRARPRRRSAAISEEVTMSPSTSTASGRSSSRTRAWKQVYSLAVKALNSPPTASSATEMSSAERSGVPLNSRCSRKCEQPCSARRLVARADADPDADAGRADAGHLLGDDPQAAGQDGTPDARGHLPVAVRARSAGCGSSPARQRRRPAGTCGRRRRVVDVDSAASAASAGRSASSSTTGTSDSLPRSSISAIWTWTFWPTESDVLDGRRPACRRPGRAAC